MHIKPTVEQLSTYSTLSGAMMPTHNPRYLLPQHIFYPFHQPILPRSICPTMPPIFFYDLCGGYGVSIFKPCPSLIMGGSDLVFAHCFGTERINLRIMVGVKSFHHPLCLTSQQIVAWISRNIWQWCTDLFQGRSYYDSRDGTPFCCESGETFHGCKFSYPPNNRKVPFIYGNW